MIDYRLSKEELAELRAAHREARAAHDVRHAYRINAVILLGQGRTVADVADALLFDPDTVRDYFKRYKNGGVDELLRMSYVGSEAMLNASQLKELDAHLYDTADAVGIKMFNTINGCFNFNMIMKAPYIFDSCIKPDVFPERSD